MESKNPSVSSNVDYVSIPLSYEYCGAFLNAMVYPKKSDFTAHADKRKALYSSDEIKNILNDKQVQLDIPRTDWVFGENGIEGKFFNNACSLFVLPKSPEEIPLKGDYKNNYILKDSKLYYVANDENETLQLKEISIKNTEDFSEAFKKNCAANKQFDFENGLVGEFKLSQDDVINLIFSKVDLNTANNLKLLCIHRMRDAAAEMGLTLTSDEANALYAFACSAKNVDQTVQALQGGIFSSVPVTMLVNFFLKIDPPVLLKQKHTTRITRDQSGKLKVFFSIVGFDVQSDKQLIYFETSYEISSKANGFSCKRVKQQPEMLSIESNFFRETLMPGVIKKLEETHFSFALNEEIATALALFIPFLQHEEFSKAFSQKFNKSTVKEETSLFIAKHVQLCFGKLTFWQRHKSKLGGTAIGLIVAGAIIVPIIVVFGWPVILAAVGGAASFAIFAAIATAIFMAIGCLAGSYRDDKRMSLFGLALPYSTMQEDVEMPNPDEPEPKDSNEEGNKIPNNKQTVVSLNIDGNNDEIFPYSENRSLSQTPNLQYQNLFHPDEKGINGDSIGPHHPPVDHNSTKLT